MQEPSRVVARRRIRTLFSSALDVKRAYLVRVDYEFTVPPGDFPQGSEIYVGFSFSWDYVSPEQNIGYQTVHRAYFRASELPAWRLK